MRATSPTTAKPDPGRLPRLARAGALLTLTALALTGCMKVDMAIDLNSDDTFDGAITFAVSESLAAAADMDPQDLADEAVGGMLDGAPDSAEVTVYDDGEFVGSTITFDGESISTFDGEEGALSIERDGDEFVVTGEIDMSEGMEGLEDMADVAPPEATIAITFPGTVSEHSGSLKGTTVTWTGEAGEKIDISARGSAVEDSANTALTFGLIGAIVLAAGGALLWFFRKGRGKTAAPLADAPSPQYPAPQVFLPQPDGHGAPPAQPLAPLPPQGQAPTPPNG